MFHPHPHCHPPFQKPLYKKPFSPDNNPSLTRTSTSFNFPLNIPCNNQRNIFINPPKPYYPHLNQLPQQQPHPITLSPSHQNQKVKMVSSPEIKINLENLEHQPLFFPKNLSQLYQSNTHQQQQQQRMSIETLRTASTSTESLLSASNTASTTTNATTPSIQLSSPYNNVNIVRSYENLINNVSYSTTATTTHHQHQMQHLPELLQQRRQFSMNNLIPPHSTAFSLNTQYQYEQHTKRHQDNNNNNNGCTSSIGSKKGNNKCYYNKFNTPSENSHNENTLILTLRIKIAKGDYRVFNLKKFDDLFISIQKFFDMNQIKHDMVKPIVNKIFKALNKVFWLLNNKIGIYDQKYLTSVYKLWMKNKDKIPSSSSSSTTTTHTNIDNIIQEHINTFTEGYTTKPKMRKHKPNTTRHNIRNKSY